MEYNETLAQLILLFVPEELNEIEELFVTYKFLKWHKSPLLRDLLFRLLVQTYEKVYATVISRKLDIVKYFPNYVVSNSIKTFK